MGLDAAAGHLVTVADELTVVGPTRRRRRAHGDGRVSAPRVVANVFLGERLRDGQDVAYEALGMTATREFRPTKEYPKGQEVYSLTFEQDGSGPASDEGDPPAQARSPSEAADGDGSTT